MNFNNLALLREAQRIVQLNAEIKDPNYQIQKDIIFHLMKQKLKKGKINSNVKYIICTCSYFFVKVS